MEILLVTLLIISLLIFAVISHSFNIKQHKKLQHEGLHNVSHLKKLIRLSQVHRGLSSAWLNGDNSKKVELTRISQELSNIIRTLETVETLNKTSRWESYIDHWTRLSKKSHNISPNDSFDQHTQLIANLLYLLEDEAERTELNASHLSELPNIGYVWRELVVTTENIGQSRAIGTGVATTKTCSSVDKIRLSFLHKHIQKTTNETLSKLSAISSASTAHDNLTKVARSKIDHFSETMLHELIEKNDITINQDEYFKLASQSMKSLEDIFDLQLTQVEELI